MARRVDLAVPGEEALERIASAQRPLGLRGAKAAYALVRETYFDTKDGALRRKGIRLCMRLDASGRHTLEVETSRTVTLQGVVDAVTFSTPAPGGELYRTLAGDSELATRIREATDPAALRPFLALDIDRESRELKSGRFARPNLVAHFDRVLAHRLDGTLFFQSVVVEEMGLGTGALEKLVQRLDEDHGLAPDGGDTLQRALAALKASGAATSPPRERAQAVLVLRKQGAVALVEGPLGLRLPTSAGSGEDAARSFAKEMVEASVSIPEAELVGFAPSRGQAPDLEVWLMECPPGPGGPDAVFWFPLQELAERIGGPRLRDPSLVAALLLLIRSEVGQRLLWESAPRIP
ncbi:MAG TPA: CYTH domain-containing protein, partial [Longimicrobiales bacterium]|nr:CYTH domain-containing protein [Longimicrobiales bacterium]